MAAIHATGKTSDAMATTTMAESPPSWDVAATETTSKKANALSSTTFPASILPAGASASSEEAFAASSLTNVIRKPTAPAISAHANSKRKERHPIDSRQLDNQSNRCRRRRPYHAGDEPSAESRSQKLFVVVAAARTGHLIGQRNRRDADKHSDERSHAAYQRVITAVSVCVTDEHLAKRLAVSPMLHRNAQKRHQDEHGDEVRVFP